MLQQNNFRWFLLSVSTIRVSLGCPVLAVVRSLVIARCVSPPRIFRSVRRRALRRLASHVCCRGRAVSGCIAMGRVRYRMLWRFGRIDLCAFRTGMPRSG